MLEIMRSPGFNIFDIRCSPFRNLLFRLEDDQDSEPEFQCFHLWKEGDGDGGWVPMLRLVLQCSVVPRLDTYQAQLRGSRMLRLPYVNHMVTKVDYPPLQDDPAAR